MKNKISFLTFPMRISMCLSDQIHLNNIEYKSGHSNISKKMDPEYEVKRILKEKDLYKILTVNKNATEADIKEKYKKIAKIVHPDRCHAEEATGAFQKLAHAYHVLSNPDERSNYDKYGDESPRPQQTYAYREEEVYPDPRRRAQARQARNNEYYGYPGNANQQQRRQNQNHQNQQGDNIPLNFMSNLISIFMMLFFIFLLLGAFDLSSLSLYFSNPASRKNLKGLIFFNEPPSSHYTIKQTKKYRGCSKRKNRK